MHTSSLVIPVERIERQIIFHRQTRVMLGSDLADLYGPVKVLNQAVKRNSERFRAILCFS